MATPAFAQDMPEGVAPQQLLDNIWIFIAAILVFFMQAGFALVEAGLTRAKNVGNIMMKHLMDCADGVLAFFIVGYRSEARRVGKECVRTFRSRGLPDH